MFPMKKRRRKMKNFVFHCYSYLVDDSRLSEWLWIVQRGGTWRKYSYSFIFLIVESKRVRKPEFSNAPYLRIISVALHSYINASD